MTYSSQSMCMFVSVFGTTVGAGGCGGLVMYLLGLSVSKSHCVSVTVDQQSDIAHVLVLGFR